MSHFGLDNDGTGFDIDDEDLTSMFDSAANASEDSGDDTILSESKADIDHLLNEFEESVDTPDQPVVEPEPDPEPIVEVEPDPEPEPTVIYEEPAPTVEDPNPTVKEPKKSTDANPVPSGNRVKVPSEADQLREARRTIAILDAYRDLTPDEKMVATQFVTNAEMAETEDHILVVKVVNCDPLLTSTMKALREAWEHDPVERAFYAMSLDQKVLHNLGSLVTVFSESDEEFDSSQSNIEYSRQLVAAIDKLNEREINFVKATERVLMAAEGH